MLQVRVLYVVRIFDYHLNGVSPKFINWSLSQV